MSFQILVDHAQWRLAEPGVSTLASGQDWDLAVSSADIYVDAATDSLMLRPGSEYPQWQSSNAGIFAKLPATDFTLTPATGWTDNQVNSGDAPFYYLADNPTGAGGYTIYALALNQSINFEWYQPPQTPTNGVAGECGWSNGGSYVAGVSLRFYFDSRAEVWKDGFLVGQYNLAGEKKHRHNRNKASKGQAVPDQYVKVMMIPCRGRELIVISSAGGSFTHVFDDIPEGTIAPVITLAEKFWWSVPANITVNHRISLCQFAAGGTAYSATSKFRKDPGAAPAGGFQSWSLADTTSGTLTISAADAVTFGAYANNVNGVRIKVVLAGVGGRTPVVFGARVYTLPVTKKTADSPVDITKYLESGGTLEATDSNSGVTGRLAFRNAPAIEGLGVAHFSTISRRPVKVIDDDGTVWGDLVLMPPETDVEIVFDAEGGVTYNDGGSNGAEIIEFAVRDRMQFADEFQFYDDAPHDGETLQNAYIEVAEQIGFQPSEIHISAFAGFTLPSAGAVTDREFNVVDKAGERGSQALRRLHEDFAANAFAGLDPIGGLQLTAIGDMPTAPIATLYDCFATMEELGVDPDPRLLIRKMRVTVIGPEANDIYTVGMDYRSRRPIISHKRDDASADPTLAVGARPLNWAGTILGSSFGSDQLATQDATDWGCDLQFDRLTPIRALVEVVCDAKARYRRGQVLKVELLSSGLPRVLEELAGAPGIAGHGIVGTSLFGRIKTWHAQFDHVAVPDDNGIAFSPWRPGRYVLQLLDGVSDAANLHVRSTHALGIREELRNRAVQRQRSISDLFQGVLSREFISQAEV